MQLVVKISWRIDGIKDIINAFTHLQNAGATVLEGQIEA